MCVHPDPQPQLPLHQYPVQLGMANQWFISVFASCPSTLRQVLISGLLLAAAAAHVFNELLQILQDDRPPSDHCWHLGSKLTKGHVGWGSVLFAVPLRELLAAPVSRSLHD